MMKWFGFPIETIEAVVDGHVMQVGVVYQWEDGTRREVWDIPRTSCGWGTVRYRSLPHVA